MSGDRIPLEGFTIDATPNENGNFIIRTPAGNAITWWKPETLRHHGIPIPRPPLVGPKITFADGTEIVMDEGEVQWWACRALHVYPRYNDLIRECHRLVAEYDQKREES